MAAEKKADATRKKAQDIASDAAAADKAARDLKKKKQEQLDRERIAAEKEAARTKLAAEKEEAKQKVLGKLESKAKEVKYKLGKAADTEKKSDEYRLSAALIRKEAAEALKPVGVSFKTWAEANLVDENVKGTSISNLKTLYRIGISPDPAAALAAIREGNKVANKALRDSKKDQKALPASGKKPGKKESFQIVEEQIASWPDTAKVDFARRLAKPAGMSVISEAAAKSVVEQNSKGKASDAFRPLWDAADAGQRLRMVDYIEQKTGNIFMSKTDADAGKKAIAELAKLAK
jgi:hypothetical protein